ncbi:MAG TPA: hypothetical protein VGG08_04540, partial [Solirubrobacteraceae bacterium]
QATHPGGAAGNYDIVATTTANAFAPGAEEEEDHTNYGWAMQIVASGTTPSGGGIAATRKIGELTWNGSSITAVTQLVGANVGFIYGPNTAANLAAVAEAAAEAAAVSGILVEKTRALAAEALLAPLASPSLTGTPKAPTAAPGTNTTQIATTAFVTAATASEQSRAEGVEATKAPTASPALTGTPTAPTAAAGTSSTQLATTAFVASALTSAKSIIPAEESRENAAYGVLGTPDEVTLTLPTNGLIAVLFQAHWQESVSNTMRAALFLNGVQQRVQLFEELSVCEGCSVPSAATGIAHSLFTIPTGLASAVGASPNAADITTGQAVGAVSINGEGEIAFTVGSSAIRRQQSGGGPCYIFANAGTYKVSVRFKASSGKVSVKERKLWASVVA